MARLIIVVGWIGAHATAKSSVVYVGSDNSEAERAMQKSEVDRFEIFKNAAGVRKSNPHPARRAAEKLAAETAAANARTAAVTARQRLDEKLSIAHSLRSAADGLAATAKEKPENAAAAVAATMAETEAVQAETEAHNAELDAVNAASQLAEAETALRNLTAQKKQFRR